MRQRAREARRANRPVPEGRPKIARRFVVKIIFKRIALPRGNGRLRGEGRASSLSFLGSAGASAYPPRAKHGTGCILTLPPARSAEGANEMCDVDEAWFLSL